jgi:predicted nucleotide-binding protein
MQYRARQNAILELGMVLARLGRDRVAIFRKKEVEDPSDRDIKQRVKHWCQAEGILPAD